MLTSPIDIISCFLVSGKWNVVTAYARLIPNGNMKIIRDITKILYYIIFCHS